MPLLRTTAGPALSVLKPASFALVKIKNHGKPGAFQLIPFCLVQLPDSFPDPKAMIKLRWWKPEDAGVGFRGKWVVWFDEARLTS